MLLQGQRVLVGAGCLQRAGRQGVERVRGAAAGADANGGGVDAVLAVGVHLHELNHPVAGLVVHREATHVGRIVAVDGRTVRVGHGHGREVAAVARLQEDDALDKRVYVHVVDARRLGWGGGELVAHAAGGPADVVVADGDVARRGKQVVIDQADLRRGGVGAHLVIQEADLTRLVVQPRLVGAIVEVEPLWVRVIIGYSLGGDDEPLEGEIDGIDVDLRAGLVVGGTLPFRRARAGRYGPPLQIASQQVQILSAEGWTEWLGHQAGVHADEAVLVNVDGRCVVAVEREGVWHLDARRRGAVELPGVLPQGFGRHPLILPRFQPIPAIGIDVADVVAPAPRAGGVAQLGAHHIHCVGQLVRGDVDELAAAAHRCQ